MFMKEVQRMARQCKSTEEKHRFVLTLPLYCEKWQRDLYSAFLIKNVNKSLTKPDNRRCKPAYPAFVKLHDKEIKRLSSMFTPSSMGIKHAS